VLAATPFATFPDQTIGIITYYRNGWPSAPKSVPNAARFQSGHCRSDAGRLEVLFELDGLLRVCQEVDCYLGKGETASPMEDMKARLETLRADAAECALISHRAIGTVKRELFKRLTQRLNLLADEVERAIADKPADDR
jgi:hypothetical protein